MINAEGITGRIASAIGRQVEDDADALLREVLQALAEGGYRVTGPEPILPELPAPDVTEDEEEATCPYVYTEADAEAVRQANAEYVARMREVHGDAANIYEQPVPTPGEVCGADLLLWDKDPVRRYLYVEGGKWIAGPSKGDGDGGGDEEVNCSSGHYWAVPEIDEWQ